MAKTIKTVQNLLVFPPESAYWYNEGEAEYLYDKVLEGLIKLERFNVIPREQLERFVEERKLALAGITENKALEYARMLSANEALLIKVLWFKVYPKGDEWDGDAAASVKLFDVARGTLISMKTVEASIAAYRAVAALFGLKIADEGTARRVLMDALSSAIVRFVQEMYKLETEVYEVSGNKVFLRNIPVGLKPGMMFKVVPRVGRKEKAFVVIDDVGENVAEAHIYLCYGPIREGDRALEYPIGNAILRVGVLLGAASMEKKTLNSVMSDALGKDISIDNDSFKKILESGKVGFRASLGMVAGNLEFGLESFATLMYSGKLRVGYYDWLCEDHDLMLALAGVGVGARYILQFGNIRLVPGVAAYCGGLMATVDEDKQAVSWGFGFGLDLGIEYMFNPSFAVEGKLSTAGVRDISIAGLSLGAYLRP